MALFEVQALTFHYGDLPALRDVTLSVEAGERIALLGSNGSGKSTLLRLLNGLYLPSAGGIRFDGEDLSAENLNDPDFSIRFRRRVALLFQDPDVQLFNATVFDEVAFGPLHLELSRDEVIARVEESMRLLEITHLRDRAPYHLSGGEKKRVALASVLVLDPDVLLLDEPTAALDPRSQSQLIEFLERLPRTKTIIAATHDLDTVQHIAERCYVLQGGQLITQGSASAVLEDHELLIRANLIYTHRHTGAATHIHPHPHGHV